MRAYSFYAPAPASLVFPLDFKAAGNQHLQFTTELWTKEENPPTPEKEERVQIMTNNEFPLLDMKMNWSP